MIAKEKAQELVKKFYQPIFDIDLGIDVSKDEKRYNSAKECALIAVDEILKTLKPPCLYEYSYWQEVKTEIKLL